MERFEETLQTLEDIRRGIDQESERLFEKYLPFVEQHIRSRMGKGLRGKLETMDLVQDALLAAIRGLEQVKFEDEKSFVAWLCRVAENRIRDSVRYFKADKRSIEKESALNEEEPNPVEKVSAGGSSPATLVVKDEKRRRLFEALESLTAPDKKIVFLRIYEKRDWNSIGESVGLAADACRMRFKRAMFQLQSELDDNLFDTLSI